MVHLELAVLGVKSIYAYKGISMLFDSHCHLEKETYGPELPEVISRAFAAGVTQMVAVGASGGIAGAREVARLVEDYPSIFAAVGVHPHDAAKVDSGDLHIIHDILGLEKVVCLGEIGLDYHYDNSPREQQRQVFRALLQLAQSTNMPAMFHVREAHDDFIEIIDEVGLPEASGMVHCFTMGPEQARAYLDRGLMLSLPGVITFKNAATLREALAIIPLEKILIETDSPYLAPVPYRGKRNEPAFLAATAEYIAQLLAMSVEDFAGITTKNARRFFRLA